jgi:hypothetical protein
MDGDSDSGASRGRVTRVTATITLRRREQVARFFDGLQLTPPGVVPIAEWSLPEPIDTTTGGLIGHVGMGRKS